MGIIISPTDYDDWRWSGSAAAPPTDPARLTQIGATGIYAWEFDNGLDAHYQKDRLGSVGATSKT